MELDEYLFFEKKKNSYMTHTYFAKLIGISRKTLYNIIHKRIAPSSLTAYKIDIVTKHQVSGWKLIFEFYSKQEKP